MKVNIKGLVFTGFAAAILSANAMAAGENIVTSKSFTEATYHKKANANFQVSKSDGTWQALGTTLNSTDTGYEPTNAVTAGTVKAYVDSAIAEVSGAAGLAGKQDITDDDSGFVVGDSEGEWAPVSSAVLDGTYTTQNVNSETGAVTIDVDATTNSALTDSTKIPTAGTVKDYVDSVASGINSTMAGKQVKSNATAGTYNVGHTGDTWATLGTAGYVQIDTTNTSAPKIQLDSAQITSSSALQSNSTKLTTEQDVKAYVDSVASSVVQSQTYTADGITVQLDTANGNKFSALTSAVASDARTLVTGDDVYDYVQGITHGNNIPAQDPLKCTATTPCALVAINNNGTMEQHWYTMATATDSGGVLGDAQ